MSPTKGGDGNRADYLKGWLNDPYIQEPVIAVLTRAEWPLTLREIADQAEVHLGGANRVLYRLYKKGRVERQKLAIQRHAFCRKRWECIPYAATRMLYVYRWVRKPGARSHD